MIQKQAPLFEKKAGKKGCYNMLLGGLGIMTFTEYNYTTAIKYPWDVTAIKYPWDVNKDWVLN
jgi:hypothetical protein